MNQLSLEFSIDKYCTGCERTQPATSEYFYRDRSKPDGLQSRCKTCLSPYHITHRKANHILHRERDLAYYRQYAATHRAQINAGARARHAKNPAPKRAMWQRWAAQHRKTTDGRKKVNGLDRESKERVFAYWGYACAVCGRVAAPGRLLSLDHWIPLSRGGPPTVTNRLPLCHGVSGCNNAKADQDPVEWLIEKLGSEPAADKLAAINAYFDTIRNSL